MVNMVIFFLFILILLAALGFATYIYIRDSKRNKKLENKEEDSISESKK